VGDAPSPTWRQRIVQALALLLLVAVGARLAADLLAPLVPALTAVVVVCALVWFIIGRHRPG
jgi:hypothetical protein